LLGRPARAHVAGHVGRRRPWRRIDAVEPRSAPLRRATELVLFDDRALAGFRQMRQAAGRPYPRAPFEVEPPCRTDRRRISRCRPGEQKAPALFTARAPAQAGRVPRPAPQHRSPGGGGAEIARQGASPSQPAARYRPPSRPRPARVGSGTITRAPSAAKPLATAGDAGAGAVTRTRLSFKSAASIVLLLPSLFRRGFWPVIYFRRRSGAGPCAESCAQAVAIAGKDFLDGRHRTRPLGLFCRKSSRVVECGRSVCFLFLSLKGQK